MSASSSDAPYLPLELVEVEVLRAASAVDFRLALALALVNTRLSRAWTRYITKLPHRLFEKLNSERLAMFPGLLVRLVQLWLLPCPF